ncbi:TonB-dependent receptor [Mucilaginibacter sabulilitoris]|uniref:TonB-dependent receptor n=1 Tax=Mucilaginibacter sabulilitoris TaxID=1173583 RepID=A0ABZ0TLS3_9SPHI|nr:TonB-dependent receptor [Mucilaginibacter sabulilitoris]WPU93143.1 TonB-dependent receptor [Mucilaginibacter sabulilitoris]
MKFYFQTGCMRPACIPKILLVMKLTVVLLITVFLQVSQASYGQRITYKGTNVPVEKLFQVIQTQTFFKVLYAEEMVNGLGNTDLNLKNATIDDALKACFKDKPLTYTITNNVIVIKYKPAPVVEKLLPVTITGKVTDDKNVALPGVNIILKGTSTSTVTDGDGNYKITVPDNKGTLIFSFVGFESAEIVPGANTVINVRLKEGNQNLNEVLVVGYGTQRKTSLTSAVSAVKGSELAKAPVPNITSSLAGRVAGISARPNGGVPGQDDPDIHVRGIGTNGSSGALIVIDGIIRPNIGQIDQNQIESVSILKDAAAVAPYGLAGANGVILITTKHGKSGAPTISLGGYYGFQRPTFPPNMLNAKDYMTLKNEGDVNSGGQAEFPADLISNYDNLHTQNPDKYPNSNAERELIKLNKPQQNYSLQISGGTDRVQYYVGFNFLRQNGVYDPLSYNRYNYNAMLDINATSTTKVTVALNNSIEQNQTGPNPQGISYIPTAAIYYHNGLWGESGGYSPAGDLESGSYARISRNTALNSISVEQQLPFVKGLSIKGVFGYDPSTETDKNWARPNYYYLYDGTKTPATYTKTQLGDGFTTLTQTFGKSQNFTYQGYLNYHRTFGNSEITGLLVAEARNGKGSSFYASRKGFSVDVDELSLGTSDRLNFDNGGSSSTSSQLGYVYRVNYAYKGKYLIEATGRYDGHYSFAPGSRWAFFPAFSGAWRLSEEPFIKNNLSFIDNLKIRGSWGKSGNLTATDYQYLTKYNLYGNAYSFGTGSLVQGSYIPREANPRITWEKANKSDVGFDASLWQGKLTVEADYFYEKRSDMLTQPTVTVPVEYGLDLAQENAGVMSNHGVEFVLGTNNKFSNGLQLGVAGNFSFAKNKLLQVFENDVTKNNPRRSRTGRSLGTPFGYQALGLFKTSDDKNGDGIIDSQDGYNITQFGTLHPGDVKYADLNGDGKIDDNDETVVGYPTYPEITYGLNLNASWKGFDITLFFQGAAHASLNIQGYQTVPFRINNTNTSYEYFDNRWTPEHQDAKYPRAYASKNTNNTTNPLNGDGFGDFSSSIWMANTGFLRLKTGVIGYTIPSAITKKFNIQSLRFYVSGQNIFTASKLKFMDPETGYTSREESYPVEKAFIFGLNVTF